MGTAPDQIRSEIDTTRERLSDNVNRLANRARPGQMVRRRTRRVRGAVSGLRDRVMGTVAESAGTARDRTVLATESVKESTGEAADTVRQTAGQAAGQVGEVAGQAREAVSRAPEQAVRQTQGNPLAAGLIAFGAGLLTASLLPTSQAEEQAASRITEQAGETLEPVKQAAVESAQQLKQDATEAAQQAAQEVKDTAAEAAKTTKEEARDKAGQVSEEARESGQQVADETRGQSSGPV
ncbi:DUF3618 domain-containing protein [Streptomyces sp. NPDC048825]|uniref:DUF3618 domain-containing protein n=1 Tax=Streptomyces sp. NPDC048825 TaxID=3365592 RepID=UPI003720FC60